MRARATTRGAQRPRARNRAWCRTALSAFFPLLVLLPTSPALPPLLVAVIIFGIVRRHGHRLNHRDPPSLLHLPSSVPISDCASLHRPSSLPLSLLLPSGRRTPPTADTSPLHPPLPSPPSPNIATIAAASALPSLRSLSTSPSTPVKPSSSSFIVTASSIARTTFFLPVVVDPPATAASSLCPSVSDHRPNHRLSALVVGSFLADDRGHPPCSLLLYWDHRASLPQSLFSLLPPSTVRVQAALPLLLPASIAVSYHCRPPHRAPPPSLLSSPADRGKNLPPAPYVQSGGRWVGEGTAVGPGNWVG